MNQHKFIIGLFFVVHFNSYLPKFFIFYFCYKCVPLSLKLTIRAHNFFIL